MSLLVHTTSKAFVIGNAHWLGVWLAKPSTSDLKTQMLLQGALWSNKVAMRENREYVVMYLNVYYCWVEQKNNDHIYKLWKMGTHSVSSLQGEKDQGLGWYICYEKVDLPL